MNKPVQVGVTGGIGAGKSIVCKVFGILGVPVYDADSRAKSLMNSNPIIKQNVISLFGEESYNSGMLNREYVAKQAFHEPGKVEKLNATVHPEVGKDYAEWTKQYPDKDYIIKEAALLFEAGSYRTLDKLITVTCPKDIRIQRVLRRDPNRTEEDVRAIINKQWSESKKIEKSDYIIENDGSHMILPQILEIHDKLLK